MVTGVAPGLPKVSALSALKVKNSLPLREVPTLKRGVIVENHFLIQ